jgi:hypothetical protein
MVKNTRPFMNIAPGKFIREELEIRNWQQNSRFPHPLSYFRNIQKMGGEFWAAVMDPPYQGLNKISCFDILPIIKEVT